MMPERKSAVLPFEHSRASALSQCPLAGIWFEDREWRLWADSVEKGGTGWAGLEFLESCSSSLETAQLHFR